MFSFVRMVGFCYCSRSVFSFLFCFVFLFFRGFFLHTLVSKVVSECLIRCSLIVDLKFVCGCGCVWCV